MLSEHNEQMSQLSDQLREKDIQIEQYERDIQVCVCVYIIHDVREISKLLQLHRDFNYQYCCYWLYNRLLNHRHVVYYVRMYLYSNIVLFIVSVFIR